MAIYIIQSGGKAGPVKIGWANTPTDRLVALQVGNPNRLSIIRVFNGNRQLEFEMHREFANQRIRNEWFKFHPHMLTYNFSPKTEVCIAGPEMFANFWLETEEEKVTDAEKAQWAREFS